MLILLFKNQKCISLNFQSNNNIFRLGAYMAVPIKINQYLSELTFYDSLNDRISYKAQLAEYNNQISERVFMFYLGIKVPR